MVKQTISGVAVGVCLLATATGDPHAQAVNREIVLWPAASATLHGNWIAVPDATAAGGARVHNPDAGLAKATASAQPTDYIEMTFNAEPGVPYRLWIRARAERNSWANDSVSVQFSGSVTSSGAPIFRIGTTSATTYVLENCVSCGLSGWGWQDNGFGAGVLGPVIYFAGTGSQTIRIQRREDGIGIDQVVLSADQWLATAPGRNTNDTKILPVAGQALSMAPNAGSEPALLPSGWQSKDIGAVGQSGSASETSGTYTLSGAGADIWGTADAFHLAYRSLTGDGTIVARVTSIQGAQAWTKMGVMIRAGTQPGASHAFMLVSTSNGLAFQRRTVAGGISTHTAGGAGTAPRWVRLQRSGDVITASASTDGRTWTTVGRDTFSMPSTVLVGLAATSKDPTHLATGTFDNVAVTASAAKPRWAYGQLQVAPNGRFLRHEGSGRHYFHLADTAWGLFRRLNRAEVDQYLKDCADKGFTAIQAAALWSMTSAGNAYGDRPLGMTDGRYDPAKIITTPGNDPANAAEYDYWDHVDYILDKAEQHGLYVAFLPTWGMYVSGTTSYALNMSSNIFTETNARSYGQFLGRRFANRPNIIWVLGGDRSAVYPNGDFRAIWRSMAEGVGEGVTGQSLVWSRSDAAWDQLMMTYHATRRDDPGSSLWFHQDPWLDFNAVQSEHDQGAAKIRTDWNTLPAKPTALLEGRYENATAPGGVLFTGAFGQRYQLYQAVFAGSLGFAYGHKSIWDFRTTEKTWQAGLNDPGRLAMKNIRQLLARFSDAELLARVPDQTLLDGPLGAARTEDLLIAMRGGDRRFALVYSTNGRDIRLNLAKLATGTADAFWFSPRTGQLHNGAGTVVTGAFEQSVTGTGAPIKVFNPPGAPGRDNDWVLYVRVRASQ
jgi:hypothetical protein